MTPPASLHVLMTADTVGGVWTYAMELCRGLQPLGVKVTLFSMGGLPIEAQRSEASQLSNVRLVATEYRLEWMQNCEADLVASGKELLALEKALKPDIVHINGYWHASLPFGAPVVTVAHSCVPSWWAACRDTPLPAGWSAYCTWVRNAIAVSDLLIGPTGAFLREFQRLHGEAGAARKIWNGCGAEKFHSAPKQYGVLAAGRLWDSAKNISLLCDAARELDVEIAVAGDIAGPDGETIAANNVVLLGKLAPDELAARMAETAIFAAPARYEPFGLTILEAALSGCALVLGDIPSLRELWDDAAVFIDPSDVAGLRDALRMLSDDPVRVAQLASKAQARAAIFAASRMARAYHDSYRALSGYTLEAVA